MARYKIGDHVISRPKSAGSAPIGETCTVVAIYASNESRFHLYEVITPEGSYRNYEDELVPLKPCEYCKNGKKFNVMNFGDTKIESYILGIYLSTDTYDACYEEDGGTQVKISYCPFCGAEVHEALDEEIEEVLE